MSGEALTEIKGDRDSPPFSSTGNTAPFSHSATVCEPSGSLLSLKRILPFNIRYIRIVNEERMETDQTSRG